MGTETELDNSPDLEFHTIQITVNSVDSMETQAYASLNIVCPDRPGQHRLRAKIDTGASGNVLPLRTLKDMYSDHWEDVLRPTSTQLTAYNDTPIPCLGTLTMKCKYKESPWKDQVWYVVDVKGPVIVGLPTCKTLDVVTIHDVKEQPSQEKQTARSPIRSVNDLKQAFPDQFDKIGNFKGKATLHLKDDAIPSIDPPRKCSVHIREKLKKELDQM